MSLDKPINVTGEARVIRMPIRKQLCLSSTLLSVSFFAVLSAAAADTRGALWAKDSKDGRTATQARDYSRAEKSLKKALLDARSFKETDPRLSQTLDDLAQVYISERKFDDARLLYLRVLKIDEAKYGSSAPELIKPLNDVVRVTCASGACYDTIPYLKRLLSINQKIPGTSPRDISVNLLLIAEAYEKRGKYDEAMDYFKQAIAAEKLKSGNGPMVASLARNVERVRREMSAGKLGANK
jgi:tetratricopeptide (TPR) repeat protein